MGRFSYPATLLLRVVTLVVLTSCNGDDGGRVEDIVVTAPTAYLWVNETLQFTAEARDGKRKPLEGRAITWRSEDPSVATVDDTGLLTGVSVGITDIVATSEGKQGRQRINVRSRAAFVGVVMEGRHLPRLEQYLPTLKVGSEVVLLADAYDIGLNRLPDAVRDMRWSSSDSTIASVSATPYGAKVTGLAPGKVTVTADFEGIRRDFTLVVGKGYTLTEFGTPLALTVEVTNLNEHGHVVGSIDRHAFVWRGGPVIDLGLEGESVAWDINDHGQVVGDFGLGWTAIRAFSWQEGQATDLSVSPGPDMHAVAINNQGEVAGFTHSRWVGGEGAAHAVVWRNGQLNDLGTLGGYAAYPLDITSQGHLVGLSVASSTSQTPFIFRDGQLSTLSVSNSWGTTGGRAVAMSEDGTVVGNTGDGAFVWRNGAFTYLAPDEETTLRVFDVNNHGQVVGQTESRFGTTLAFLWQDGVALDLSGLVDLPLLGTLTNARAINDRGQIAVETDINGGPPGGALLTPVP
ncbi:Ig-like domain-containing protein [Pyxidicoccus xibeiensis]|uniref:Ig-like domain-containing protein n=1 Tax=Pyxidicoccus xibeiensis TaxID=2906759 RepID=UPI0020A70ED4|nr:Ig-like domain-containing protein [Pyxidicoccus xibeiensis]MCP3143834.1 Ig-like domain-containing protein [Pyxidicoccus xibeiensis]